ncbi:MAG: CHC2 zinc finger domain-containing protein [Rhodanobacter sp.]
MLNSLRALYGSKPASRIPDNWRDRLPEPATYYAQHVAKLGQPKGNGYAVGLCPFHDDHSPSFGVNLTGERGAWCCYAGCGKGDMVTFHQRLTGLDFKAAVRELIGGSR